MGKKLNRLLGGFRKASKLKPTLKLAATRLLVLKNRRKVHCAQSRSDVVQLLHLGHHDTALLRVEQVIKEQNMLDAYAIMENYLNLLIERLSLIEHQKECPEEVKEAVAGLIFASSRCGDFPELQEIRAAFFSLYGKEFVTRCVELRNHCGVNTKMIQKMSTLAPSLETKTKLLNEIASENNVLLHLNQSFGPSKGGAEPSNFEIGEEDCFNSSSSSHQSIDKTEFTDSFKARHNKHYKDVADAAQDAFENAAYAAAAARAAVELSRTGGPHQPDYLSRLGPPKRPEDQENWTNFDRAGSFYSSDVGPDADLDNVPRLNLDRMPISLRARRVSGY